MEENINQEIKKQLTENEREHIIDLHKRNYSIATISDIYKINESTTRRIIKKNRFSHTNKRNQGSGLLRKYNKDTVKQILISIIKKERGLT